MAGLAFGVRDGDGDLGQKSGPQIQSTPDQTRTRPRPRPVQLQPQLQLRTYLGLNFNIVVVEMALCGSFHAVLCLEGGRYAFGLASRAGLQVKSYRVMMSDREEGKDYSRHCQMSPSRAAGNGGGGDASEAHSYPTHAQLNFGRYSSYLS